MRRRRLPVPTFSEWFNGRFWREWVVGRKNKPSECESKRSIFAHHLEPAFGDLRLDAIGAGAIAQLRASLVERGLSEKRINNILAVLSKSLRYAPKVWLFKIERPEIVAWEFDEYAAILGAARRTDSVAYAAVCLAGEAGLRVGEIKALLWREVDLVARTLIVSRQMRQGIIGTPKGRTRRAVPMTEALYEALREISNHSRTGLVIAHMNGRRTTESQIQSWSYEFCRKAGLPARGWHALRHAFGTHAAYCGVNPWRLMVWMGHKRIDETMIYVNLTSVHARPLPERLRAAGAGETDPDRRILAMLSARSKRPSVAGESQGSRTNKVNYSCSDCGFDVWAKANLAIVCGDCDQPLKSQSLIPMGGLSSQTSDVVNSIRF